MEDRIRFALVVALALVTSYAVAMSMGWPKPYWAGIAVAVCSLETVGESLFKALQRLAGTAVAIPIALTLVALFAQDRWQYALAAGLWLAFCTYRTQSPTTSYFWYCAGFYSLLLSLMSGFDSQNSFYVVVERAKETVLGIMCYSVFAVALSAKRGRQDFNDKVLQQIGLLRARLHSMRGAGPVAEVGAAVDERRRTIGHVRAQLEELHDAASLEDFNTYERSRAWGRFISDLSTLTDELDQFESSLAAAGLSDGSEEQRRIDDALGLFEARLASVSRILKEGTDFQTAGPIAPLELNAEINAARSPFEEGGRLLREDILRSIDATTRDLENWALDLMDVRRFEPSERQEPRPATFLPNPEYVLRAITQFCMFWAVFLMFIYIPDLPGGELIVIFGGVLSIKITRQLSVNPMIVLVPILATAVLAGGAHVFIMPRLDGFIELGTMLFVGAFLLGLGLYSTKLRPIRSICFVFFIHFLQISTANQTYSVTYVLNMVVALTILLLVLTLGEHMPISWRPQDAVRRMLRRYADSLDGLLSGLQWSSERTNSWWAWQLRNYHLSQLRFLPQEIAAWSSKIDNGLASKEQKAALVALADTLEVLSDRVTELARMRKAVAEPQFIALLRPEVAIWRTGILSVVETLRTNSASVDPAHLSELLQNKIARLEAAIAKAVNEGELENVSSPGIANMQRVLAAYDSVSRALIQTAMSIRNVAWERLAETRF